MKKKNLLVKVILALVLITLIFSLAACKKDPLHHPTPRKQDLQQWSN